MSARELTKVSDQREGASENFPAEKPGGRLGSHTVGPHAGRNPGGILRQYALLA